MIGRAFKTGETMLKVVDEGAKALHNKMQILEVYTAAELQAVKDNTHLIEQLATAKLKAELNEAMAELPPEEDK